MRKEDLAEIFSYIAGIIKNCECCSISVGGTTNHIHILCTLNKNLALSKLIATIKANSSKWLHQKDSYYRAFAWQNGYGAFSVSQNAKSSTPVPIAERKLLINPFTRFSPPSSLISHSSPDLYTLYILFDLVILALTVGELRYLVSFSNSLYHSSSLSSFSLSSSL